MRGLLHRPAGPEGPVPGLPRPDQEVRGNKRLEALAKINRRFAEGSPDTQFDATATATEEAVKLMRSPALEAFELDEVKPADARPLRRHDLRPRRLLARRLVEKGVRFVQVNRGGFDTHTTQLPGDGGPRRSDGPGPGCARSRTWPQPACFKDAGRDAQRVRPHTADQQGRRPRSSPPVFTALLAGGGLKGGQVIGSSDEDGAMPADRPVQVADLHATVCHALGIDPNKEVWTPLHGPMKLVDGGKPIGELFA